MKKPPRKLADALARALLRWWGRHGRDLPWRRRSDPYAVWVSEIMLQQTRVATVGGYYERFLDAFPTVQDLAQADEQSVLKAWEGMGYYARARNLHAAARLVVAQHDGRLPESSDELRGLPGIGRYTAAAIASIAFGHDEAVLDGNVTRVICRLFRVRQDPRKAATRRKLIVLAQALILPRKAGLINQALMDLGATVCTPRNPQCDRCPLRSHCVARARGERDRLPLKPPRKPLPHYDVAVAVIRKRGRVLIDRRKPDGLLGGLWEFPGGKPLPGESLQDALVREVKEELGIDVSPVAPLVSVRHAYSHFRVTLHAFVCRHRRGRCRAIACTDFKWVPPDQLDDYPFPKATHKIIAALREREAEGP